MKTIEFVLAIPFLIAGFLWEFVMTGFRAGRVLYGFTK
jgi:hypothetical protein